MDMVTFMSLNKIVHSSSASVLVLNEMKLDPHYPKELLTAPGYQHWRHDRSCSGIRVCLYNWDSLAYRLRYRDVGSTQKVEGNMD